MSGVSAGVREKQDEVNYGRGSEVGVGGGCAGVCPGVVVAWGAASPLAPLCPLPLVPPYHLCLPHLKGWLLPLLLSPFVLLTNVAALEGIAMFFADTMKQTIT